MNYEEYVFHRNANHPMEKVCSICQRYYNTFQDLIEEYEEEQGV